MQTNLKKPCKECPFRRESMPGWLGPWGAQDIINHLQFDGVFPCHKTIKHDKMTDDDPSLEHCAGATIHLNNKIQRHRHPVVAKHQKELSGIAQEIKDSVFQWSNEFVDYHERKMK